VQDIPRWRIALVAAALVVLGALGAGLVMANDPAATTPANNVPGASPTGAGPEARPRQLTRAQRLQRLIHVEATLDLPQQGIVTVGRDHGTISSIGNGSIGVAEKDGHTVTLKTSDETKVRKGGVAAALGDLKVGDEVVVMSRLESGSFVAYRIVVPPAATTNTTP
jgi:hypothetical protein